MDVSASAFDSGDKIITRVVKQFNLLEIVKLNVGLNYSR